MKNTDVLIARFIELARQRLKHKPDTFQTFELEIRNGPNLGRKRRGMAAQYWPIRLEQIAECAPDKLDECLISEIDTWANSFNVAPLAENIPTVSTIPADKIPALPGNNEPEPWQNLVPERARNIWLRELHNCKKPTKKAVANEIARWLRDDKKLLTKRGQRIEGNYVYDAVLKNWNPPRIE